MEQLTEDRVAEIARKVAQEVVAQNMSLIAETSAARGIEIVAAQVGMTLIKKIVVAIGLAALVFAGWAATKGLWPTT